MVGPFNRTKARNYSHERYIRHIVHKARRARDEADIPDRKERLAVVDAQLQAMI